jgi:hypothetical protein
LNGFKTKSAPQWLDMHQEKHLNGTLKTVDIAPWQMKMMRNRGFVRSVS